MTYQVWQTTCQLIFPPGSLGDADRRPGNHSVLQSALQYEGRSHSADVLIGLILIVGYDGYGIPDVRAIIDGFQKLSPYSLQ
jgi:hypothetical protein